MDEKLTNAGEKTFAMNKTVLDGLLAEVRLGDDFREGVRRFLIGVAIALGVYLAWLLAVRDDRDDSPVRTRKKGVSKVTQNAQSDS